MSSPLSMLKKTKRSPLQGPVNERWGRHKVPLRRNMFKEFQASMAAAAAADDDDDDDDESSDPTPLLTYHTAANDATTSKSKARPKKGAPPSDFELMSAMMRRVSLLEQNVTSQAKEIELKDERISVLDAELRLLTELDGTHPSCSEILERRCQQLQSQVCEMDGFLEDYGLIWVGDGESEQPDSPLVRGFNMDFDLVLQRTSVLNILAGEGESFVQSTATGAQFAQKDPIQLGLYRNGIVMFEGPFRSYQEHSTQRCMQDLMDGYFPSELQERFPDGVPFKVHDRRDQDFISRTPWSKFPGEGKAIRDEPSNAVGSQLPGRKLSTDQFLNRLPKVVVKAGCVIDIRDSLRAVLQGSSDAQSSNSVILVDTPALQVIQERLQTSSPVRPSSARDVITLKVKSEDGNQTYILKMCFSETMGDLRQHLDKRRGGGLPDYDVISAYPQCHYDDDRQTLQSCGLTTNATLLVRRSKHPHPPTEVNKVNR
ncbi:UBX domain-containing protein 11 isoform X2 [Pseudoliparis swirei]|uniref:UBX domain-containing protein 11 isoform X2 n=1 Tax=Pseudoliparis swirei TaxID=2059687 RepID=UPI0024BE73F4|nr:UBX domain-containing protein 11 isoform X2 [Pseudoliparis swirei]